MKKVGIKRHLEGESNTTLPNESTQSVTKKQGNRYRFWQFTLFNYDDIEKDIKRSLIRLCIFGQYIHEKCPDTGRNHLQGFFELKNKKGMRLSELKKPLCNTIHLEPTYSGELANLDYTSKEGGWDLVNFGRIKLSLITILLPWQVQICDIIEGETDNRTIHWIVSNGNVGATVLCKYLVAKEDAICATKGCYSDLAQILAGEAKNGRDLNEKTVIVFNYGRSASGISYAGLESIKDGLITSAKYESRTLCFNSPHLFIFANKLPDIKRFTKDKWKIWEVIDRHSPMRDITNETLRGVETWCSEDGYA